MSTDIEIWFRQVSQPVTISTNAAYEQLNAQIKEAMKEKTVLSIKDVYDKEYFLNTESVNLISVGADEQNARHLGF